MNGDKELLLDEQVAPSRFTKDQITEWASDKRIFISSTMRDLEEDRRIAEQAITTLGAEPRMFENLVKDGTPRAAFLTEVRQCDLFLLLLGERYGEPDDTGFPATRQEYTEAVRCGKSILALQNQGMAGQRESELSKWMEELEKERVVNRYSTHTELKQSLKVGLNEFVSEKMIQWVKMDNMIFLAQSIEHHGVDSYGRQRITLEAKIKNPRIISALGSISQQFHGRVRVTFGLDTLECQKIVVKRSSAAAGQTLFTIECETVAADYGMSSGQRHFIAQTGAYNKHSHRDMIGYSIRSVTFNESIEEFSGSFEILPKGELLPIYQDWKDEPQHFSVIARFYIIEKLRGEEALVQSITHLDVGKVQSNKVRIRIGVLPFQDFDSSGEILELDGYLDLALPKTKPKAW